MSHPGRQELESLLAVDVPGEGRLYAIGGRQSLTRSLTIYARQVAERPFPGVERICDIMWTWSAGTYSRGHGERRIFVHIADRTGARRREARAA